ncbi:DUF1841 family protein [Thiohalocapsa marina]|uniref:DUF1841 family protein n=1 Tax=Thiohalocapsa marina TaxID=424902 RepID=UPI0036D8571C
MSTGRRWLALQEQLATDQPPGMHELYQQMIEHCLGDVHDAEHRVMACLPEAIWHAQGYGRALDKKACRSAAASAVVENVSAAELATDFWRQHVDCQNKPETRESTGRSSSARAARACGSGQKRRCISVSLVLAGAPLGHLLRQARRNPARSRPTVGASRAIASTFSNIRES